MDAFALIATVCYTLTCFVMMERGNKSIGFSMLGLVFLYVALQQGVLVEWQAWNKFAWALFNVGIASCITLFAYGKS